MSMKWADLESMGDLDEQQRAFDRLGVWLGARRMLLVVGRETVELRGRDLDIEVSRNGHEGLWSAIRHGIALMEAEEKP